MFGPNSQHEMKSLHQKSNFGLTLFTRYLGVQIHYNRSMIPEQQNTIRSARKTFREYNALWRASVNMQFKVNVFMSTCVAILISCLTASHMSSARTNVLENQYDKMIRSIGASHGKHFKAATKSARAYGITSESIRRFLGVSKLRTIMASQRLNFLQTSLANVSHHEVLWTALVGKYTFEKCYGSNPFDEVGDLAEQMEIACRNREGQALRLLLENSEYANDFLRFDVRKMKSADIFQHGIQYEHDANVSHQYDCMGDGSQGQDYDCYDTMEKCWEELYNCESEYQYICGMVDNDGDICQQCFNTKQVCTLHQRTAKMDFQARVASLSSLVVSNICLACRTVLSD